MQQYLYLTIDIGCIIIPLLASFYKPHPFYKTCKAFFFANITVTILFLIWDEIFTEIGVWGFNRNYLTGIYLGHLPLEEILFFVCIPYACVFTYFAIQYLKPKLYIPYLSFFNNLLAITLLGVGLFNLDRYYTSFSFIGLSIFLTFLYRRKIKLDHYYLSYILILPFFFLSNGILTGSFLPEPIVWYNDDENLGIRMFTIPIEDIFYGMLLVFGNIHLYQKLKQKFFEKN